MGNTAILNDVRQRLGLKSDAALARVLGVSGHHLMEVKRGSRMIGGPMQSAIDAALAAAKGSDDGAG